MNWMGVEGEAARSAIVGDLPMRSRWMFDDTPLDWDFSDARRWPRRVTNDDLAWGEIDEEWADLIIFGRFDYAEGGGASPWITIRKTDGAVCGLDVERECPVYLINSSLVRFIRSFSLLDQYLGRRRPPPHEIGGSLREIDPEGILTRIGDC